MNTQIHEIFGLRQSVAALTVKLARRAAAALAIFSGALFISALVTQTAEAQSLTTLHNFADAHSDTGLVRDSLGNLYGTTAHGGSSNSGTVFKLDVSNNLTVLHNFSSGDGNQPRGTLVLDSSGNLYGTTIGGGSSGIGTAFKLSTSDGGFTVLHNFSWADTGRPSGGLALDSFGNLYGTSNEYQRPQTLFKLSTSDGGFTVVHNFSTTNTGIPSPGNPVLDSSGNLYGTTLSGGSFGFGTVFKFSIQDGFTVLRSLSSAEGSGPYGLVLDSGNLYGTAISGGSSGFGTVFKISTSGSDFSVLHNFSGTNGASPTGDLVLDSSGNLYGTTLSGGSFGFGTVFKFSTSDGGFTVLHNFSRGTDGGDPQCGLILDSAGNLYGTTRRGGSFGHGTVFSVDTTPPVITEDLIGTLRNNGWYVTSVAVDWAVTDNESTVTSKSGCDPTTVNTDGSTTLTCSATSAGGTNSRSVTIKHDITAPNVSCAAADGSWHASDVGIQCIASDVTSGLVDSSSFALTTSIPSGSETANALTDIRNVTDQAGNSTPAGPIGGNKIDKKAPSISIASPIVASYLLNQAVSANYSCSDGGSGVASCAGAVANGGVINTASGGAKTFAVNAADNVANASSVSVSYTVNYNFSGYMGTVTNAPTVNTGKAGRTYPVRWQLRDGNGAFISALAAVTSVTYQPTFCSSFASAPTDPLETSTTGSSGLRYDSATNQYHYNWASPSTAGCYTLFLRLDSGQILPANFNLN